MDALSHMQNKLYKKKISRRRIAELLFFASLVIIPTIQFFIFYVGVNFNSFIQAFKKYELPLGSSSYIISFAKFENFSEAWAIMKNNLSMFTNALILFAWNMLVGMPLAVIFSFYIYKKYTLSGLYKVVLFMPQIISGLVFALLFNYITTNVYQTIVQKLFGKEVYGLLYDLKTRFGTVIFFNLWVSFGSNVLLFSGSMSGIDPSVVESARIDGANVIQELWYITLPLIYPTVVQLIIIGITSFCSNQMNLMNLYGAQASESREMGTIGFFLYKSSTTVENIATRNTYSFGQLSAMGLILTMIMLPITLIARKLMNKYGPSTD